MGRLAFLRTGAARATRAAPALELLEDASGTRALAFGVQWRSIATGAGRDEAVRMARRADASHYLFRRQQLGVGVLPRDTPAALRVYPAASVAARHVVGDAVCVLRIGDSEYWIAALANGAPTSVDRFVQGIRDADAVEKARELTRQVFAGAATAPTVYTNLPDCGMEAAKSYSPEDLFHGLASAGDMLQPVPGAGTLIPKPVLVTGIVLALVLTAQQASQWWGRRKAGEAALLAVRDEPEPEQAWAEAIARWQVGKAAASGTSLLEARDQLHGLPLRWGGWILQSAACRALPAPVLHEATQRTWSCQARYTRGRDALVNRRLAEMLPAGWSASFAPLNGIEVRWEFTQAAKPLKLSELPPADFFRVEIASRLQQLLPALAGEVSYSFAPVEIPPPKRRDGTALPVPPQAQGLAAATLVVKAPMRNIDALIQADVIADWNEISLAFEDRGPKGALKASTVMAQAKGDMYARN